MPADDALPDHAATDKPAESGAGRDREIELKFAADPRTLKAAQALPWLGAPAPGPQWRVLRTVYFDTPNGRLAKHDVALRMRRARGGMVMGLKWPAPASSGPGRGEIERTVRASAPELDLLGAEGSALVREITRGQPLTPVFTTEVRRAVRLVERDGAVVEVAFDTGSIVAGAQKMPLCEIELELKSGPVVGLIGVACDLVAALPVTLDPRSKAARGAKMVGSGSWDPVQAASLPFVAETSTDEAIRQVMAACIDQFTANWPGALAGHSPGCIHQMRVSMRRLRAALAMCNRAFPCAEFQAVRAEAKRIASAMGQARDWDVFGDHVRTGAGAGFPGEAGLALLAERAQARAEAGHEAVRTLLRDPATTAFVLQVLDLAARRPWRNGAEGGQLSLLAGPVAVFAAQTLERLDRKVRRRGRGFARLDPEARHEVRIALKNVRYAADFFGGIFKAAGDAKRYARKASALQDFLGLYNDIAVAARLVHELNPENEAGLAYAAGLIVGWQGEHAHAGKDQLETTWRQFVKAERYWRAELARMPSARAAGPA